MVELEKEAPREMSPTHRSLLEEAKFMVLTDDLGRMALCCTLLERSWRSVPASGRVEGDGWKVVEIEDSIGV